MQITVFGASGRVGRRVVDMAVKRGHHVTAFIHGYNPFIESDQLDVVEGDIKNTADVGRALTGSHAVISTLGSWGTVNKDILSSGMQTIVPAMETHNIKRIISLTGADAQTSSEKPKFLQKISHGLFNKLQPKIMRDAEEHIKTLENSQLDWTVIRSPIMNNYGPAHYKLRLKWPLPIRTINRQAVAEAMVDQLESKDFIRQAPTIFRR